MMCLCTTSLPAFSTGAYHRCAQKSRTQHEVVLCRLLLLFLWLLLLPPPPLLPPPRPLPPPLLLPPPLYTQRKRIRDSGSGGGSESVLETHGVVGATSVCFLIV